MELFREWLKRNFKLILERLYKITKEHPHLFKRGSACLNMEIYKISGSAHFTHILFSALCQKTFHNSRREYIKHIHTAVRRTCPCMYVCIDICLRRKSSQSFQYFSFLHFCNAHLIHITNILSLATN